jgi:hypothetical protein
MDMHHQSEWGPRSEREPRDEVHILGKNSEPFWLFLDGLVLAYLLVLRVCHHEIVPGKAWSIFQLQQALRLRVMTNQVEHKVKVKMAKAPKAA